MSQHWEDRTEEDLRAFRRVLRGCNPRTARRSEWPGNFVVAVILVALIWAICGAPRPW